MKVAVVGHVEWIDFVPVPRRAGAGRDPRRPRVLGPRGRRRRRGGGDARAARRSVHVPDRARRRPLRAGVGRGARGAGRHDGGRLARHPTAPRVLLPRRRRASGRSPSSPTSCARAATSRLPGTSSRGSTRSTSRAATPMRFAPRGRPGCSSRPRGSSRRSARPGWRWTRSSAAPPTPTRPMTDRSSRRRAWSSPPRERRAGGSSPAAATRPRRRLARSPIPTARATPSPPGSRSRSARDAHPPRPPHSAATVAAEQLTRRGAY